MKTINPNHGFARILTFLCIIMSVLSPLAFAGDEGGFDGGFDDGFDGSIDTGTGDDGGFFGPDTNDDGGFFDDDFIDNGLDDDLDDDDFDDDDHLDDDFEECDDDLDGDCDIEDCDFDFDGDCELDDCDVDFDGFCDEGDGFRFQRFFHFPGFPDFPLFPPGSNDVCLNIAGIQTHVPAGLVADGNGNCVSSTIDVCPNIPGVQTHVPFGKILDQNGNCVPGGIDVCQNIAGIQATIPAGLVADGNGNCVSPGIDVCLNIQGVQTTIPAGLVADGHGNCVQPQNDVCPNIQGVQTQVPAGFIVDNNGNCVPANDVCPNIQGIQTTIPAGFVLDQNGNCVPANDVCPNIQGVQTAVPAGMTLDQNGNCVPVGNDVCPNIQGIQTHVPSGFTIDNNGNCVPIGNDVCPNIQGVQTTVPQGMVIDQNGNCIPGNDVCPNIGGVQTTIPAGMVIDQNGNCVAAPTDVCPNIQGTQTVVPTGMVIDQNGNCVFPAQNHLPVLDPIGNKVVNEGQLLQFNATASDPDGDNVTISAVNLPSGASFNGHVFSWTPSLTQSGFYSVTFIASDGSLTDSETILITVIDINPNHPPVLDPIGNKFTNEGQLLQFGVTASDPDGDTVFITATNLPAGASFNGMAFTWTPGFQDAGIYFVTFTASDGLLTDSETITITVGNVNRPPTLNLVDKIIEVGRKLVFFVVGVDPDQDPLTYNASNLPSGSKFFNQKFTWVPNQSQLGRHNLSFSVTDGQFTASDNMTITVIERTIKRLLLLDASFPDGEVVRTGEPLLVLVSVENDGTVDLKDVRVRAYIMDHGIELVSDTFDLHANYIASRALVFSLPDSLEPGVYYVGFSIANGDERKVVYREFTLI